MYIYTYITQHLIFELYHFEALTLQGNDILERKAARGKTKENVHKGVTTKSKKACNGQHIFEMSKMNSNKASK